MTATASNYTTPAGNPTPKWRGVSISSTIRTTQRELADTQAGIRALNASARQLQRKLQQQVEDLIGISDVQLGVHTCPESPTLMCVYPPQDRCRDQCLFCADPAERK